MSIHRFGASGGLGGVPFDDRDAAPFPYPLENTFISEIRVRHGKFVDSIQIVVTSTPGGQSLALPRHGGTGGDETCISLGRDKAIKAIRGRHGLYLDSLTIEVQDATGNHDVTKYGPFGGSGGDVDFAYEAPYGESAPGDFLDGYIVGFVGRSGEFLDALGVLVARVYYIKPGP